MPRPRRIPKNPEHVTTKDRELRHAHTARRQQTTKGVKPVPKTNGHANETED